MVILTFNRMESTAIGIIPVIMYTGLMMQTIHSRLISRKAK